jgi:choline-sulfatase
MADRPGISLRRLAEGETPDRTLLVEYHATGSAAGAFMVRVGKWKYVYYANLPAELYDLEADPEELHDLAADPAHQAERQRCHARLLELCNPDAVEQQAKARQAELIALHGGRQAIVERGDFGNTPAPSEKPRFY